MTESRDDEARQRAAKDHLWMHFTRHSSYDTHEVPTIVRGDGVHIWDAHGNKCIDGLAGLFVVQAGHGRTELAEAAAKQAASVKTVQGEGIKLSLKSGKLTLNGNSRLIVADVKTSNGVVHAINTVLVPPSAVAECSQPRGT